MKKIIKKEVIDFCMNELLSKEQPLHIRIKNWIKLKDKIDMRIYTEKRMWCSLKTLYYSSKKDVIGRYGEIVGESRDGKAWRVKWEGTKSIYNYPKEYIKLEK